MPSTFFSRFIDLMLGSKWKCLFHITTFPEWKTEIVEIESMIGGTGCRGGLDTLDFVIWLSPIKFLAKMFFFGFEWIKWNFTTFGYHGKIGLATPGIIHYWPWKKSFRHPWLQADFSYGDHGLYKNNRSEKIVIKSVSPYGLLFCSCACLRYIL